MQPIISANNVNKRFGKKQVLSDISFTVSRGEIVGVIGSNGAGKTTLLRSLLGLTSVDGDILVNGLSPQKNHEQLMEKVSFIADTATLPSWITCQQLLAYLQGVHPFFDLDKAEHFIKDTKMELSMKVSEMSKGMVTQLHLAVVMAIDSNLLVLDEPTLGLDILRRKAFYNQLLDDYYDDDNTIVITTHQVEEIERILTRVLFIDKGSIIADINVNEIEARYVQVHATSENQAQLNRLNPISISKSITGDVYLFDGVDKNALSNLGKTSIPELSDLFIALYSQHNTTSSKVEVSHA